MVCILIIVACKLIVLLFSNYPKSSDLNPSKFGLNYNSSLANPNFSSINLELGKISNYELQANAYENSKFDIEERKKEKKKEKNKQYRQRKKEKKKLESQNSKAILREDTNLLIPQHTTSKFLFEDEEEQQTAE